MLAQGVKTGFTILVLAASYVALGKLGLEFAVSQGYATIFWPPPCNR